MLRHPLWICWALCLLTACGSPPEVVEFSEPEVVSAAALDLELGHDIDERFAGLGVAPPAVTDGDLAPLDLTWETPEHWQTGAEAPRRLATYHPQGDEQVVMTISRFPTRDLAGNFARWLRAFQRGPLSPEAIAALPTVTTLGSAHPVLSAEGAYDDPTAGISGDDYALLGVMVPLPDQESSLFFKLVGPAAAVAAERDAFLAVVESLAADGP